MSTYEKILCQGVKSAMDMWGDTIDSKVSNSDKHLFSDEFYRKMKREIKYGENKNRNFTKSVIGKSVLYAASIVLLVVVGSLVVYMVKSYKPERIATGYPSTDGNYSNSQGNNMSSNTEADSTCSNGFTDKQIPTSGTKIPTKDYQYTVEGVHESGRKLEIASKITGIDLFLYASEDRILYLTEKVIDDNAVEVNYFDRNVGLQYTLYINKCDEAGSFNTEKLDKNNIVKWTEIAQNGDKVEIKGLKDLDGKQVYMMWEYADCEFIFYGASNTDEEFDLVDGDPMVVTVKYIVEHMMESASK